MPRTRREFDSPYPHNKVNKTSLSIPKPVSRVTDAFEAAGFEAYLVGGCVRDLVVGKTPKDWDVATNATPDEITAIFPKTFYDNAFGTVGIVSDGEEGSLKVVEATTYRLEGSYSDGRRPEHVVFSKNIADDLKRRDFTVNAMAYRPATEEFLDLFNGKDDAANRVIRAVGNAEERFGEDGLRILRAIRLAAELGFTIEPETAEAIKKCASMLEKVSTERIRDEFNRILLSDYPRQGLILARNLGVLSFITKEPERGIGIDQNQAHKYDVWEHNLHSLQHAADRKWPLEIRIASLFHDIYKPETRRWSDEKKDWTFHGHDVVGSRVTKKELQRLKYSSEIIDVVSKLVRWHMFFSDTEQITLSAVRRLIVNVGKENVWALMDLRACDRIGTGRPKENPYRLRKYKAMVEEAMRDPVSVGMLKIDGGRIMQIAGIEPGPKIGHILHALLEEVLDDPAKNTEEYMEKRALELSKMSEQELAALGEKGKEEKKKLEEAEIKEIRGKYHVE